MSEWIEWKGGDESPVDEKAMIDVRLRSGQEVSEITLAPSFMWRHLGTKTDILAYRVIKK